MRTKILQLIILLFAVTQLNAQTAGTLTVSYTTKTANGSESPDSYDACWIVIGDVESATVGTWVKTLIGTSGGKKSDMYYWKTATASTYNIVDATTAATYFNSYGKRDCTWNGTNSATPRVQQNDGDYTVKMELTDDKAGTASSSHVVGYKFTKGPVASTGTLSTGSVAIASISAITVQWTPVSSAVQNVEMDKLYSVYPNPAVSSIYVTGLNIEGIDICSLSGKILLMSDVQNVNISKLPKGAYLAVIYTKAGTVVKKIQKI